MYVLGFGAHPDDVEIFFLGTLLTYQQAGHRIGWVVATDGAQGIHAEASAQAQLRRSEAVAAGGLCGVAPIFLGRADGGLPVDDHLMAAVETVLLEHKPDLIITHPPEDYHPDHRALSRAVVDAARFRIPVLFADTMMGTGFTPDYYVDISAHSTTKAAAIRCHASQRPERFVEAASVLARLRALQCNTDQPEAMAEAFRFEPRHPFADPRDLLPPAPPVRGLGTFSQAHKVRFSA